MKQRRESTLTSLKNELKFTFSNRNSLPSFFTTSSSRISNLFNDEYLTNTFIKIRDCLSYERYSEIESELASLEESFEAYPMIYFDILLLKCITLFAQIKKLLNFTFTFYKTKPKTKTIESLFTSAKETINIMITIALPDNDYHYEKISQIYAELLYLNAILLKRKKENVSAYSFISLAINILKVFFVSNKPAYDIRTYYIYSLCLLMLIQMLIEDNNYIDVVNNQKILFKVCFMMLKRDIDELMKRKVYSVLALNFYYRGLIYELLNERKIESFGCFKQSSYFFRYANFIQDDNTTETKKKSLLEVFSDNIIDHYKHYINVEKKKKNIMIKEKINNMKIITNDCSNNKINVVKCDAYFYNNHKKAFKKVENFYNKNKNMLKLDDNLVNFVDDNITKSMRMRSSATKKNLAHFYLYDKLLSLEYKDYISKSTNFEFDNPSKSRDAISHFEHYIIEKKERHKAHSTSSRKTNFSSLLSKNYQKKYKYIDNLSKKEYAFQKIYLNEQKNNTTYFILNNSDNICESDTKSKEKANLSFQLIKHRINKQIEEFDYNKVRGFSLYSKVFQMNNKKRAITSINKVFTEYRRKNKKEKINPEQYNNKELVHKNIIDNLRVLNTELDELEKKTDKRDPYKYRGWYK